MSKEEYLQIEYDRVKKNLYNGKRRSFGSSDNLAKWFKEQLIKQDFCCVYCKTSIFDIEKLIKRSLLKTRAVRGKGCRDPVLEIDKNDKNYSPEKCVLACYYCNNDKSYTSTKEVYEKYFGPNRGVYFQELLKNIDP